jgi:hypothetical protein
MGKYLRYSERGLRQCRWIHLLFNLVYQLDLTRAQLPMRRLGKRIELLVGMTAVCAHASRLDPSAQRIAELQAETMKGELKAVSCVRGLGAIARIRRSLHEISQDFEAGECSMVNSVEPQAHAHPWD